MIRVAHRCGASLRQLAEVHRLSERRRLSADEFAAKVDERLPGVEAAARAAELLSAITYSEDVAGR